MRLASAPKIAANRCARPEDTLVRVKQALGSLCRYRYEEHRVSDSLYWGAALVEELNFPAMGRGTTPLLCRIATLAEALEWRALGHRRALPGHVHGAQAAVPAALRIEDLLAHIATVTPAVAARIQALDLAQHWVDGFSLMRDESVRVPLEYVHAIGGTNGLAAGNGLEEALVHGVCEVFERRAVITVVKNRMVVPTIDAATIRHPVIRDQLEALRRMGVSVTLKDLSFGGVLPCVGAYLVRSDLPEDRQARHLLKAAAAFDLESALSGCLGEFAQVARLGDDAQSWDREDERLLARDDTENFLPLFWFGYVPFRNADFLREGEVIPFERGPVSGDCLEDVHRAQEVCRQLGKDFVAVDLSSAAGGFPVVQTIVPGYSDILPYHPASSPVLFKGWTRDLAMGDCLQADGSLRPLTARSLFPASA